MVLTVEKAKQRLLRCVLCHEDLRRGALEVENCAACGVCFHRECRKSFASDCPTMGCESPLDGRWHSEIRASKSPTLADGLSGLADGSLSLVRIFLRFSVSILFSALITLAVTLCFLGLAKMFMESGLVAAACLVAALEIGFGFGIFLFLLVGTLPRSSVDLKHHSLRPETSRIQHVNAEGVIIERRLRNHSIQAGPSSTSSQVSGNLSKPVMPVKSSVSQSLRDHSGV
jgi:hypothetical protein